ncbi:DUF4252 domain-containing protein [Alkalitalea saponilacus]|uniref:DUF4252 domain-containing protein n=1 Tax=Alkalitalea saponilacus TaxID=889453 RepID=A0A1T5HTN7_9BACT|nr:DUF4252 domain-containing protein [Alkalitalea saponilacus]ASB49305.1 hypothetical protein CDL62_09200 [Alkalitalea saponilacus]SKC24055.1 protein of unknown function [Alkalitalea saponilacus]
MRTVLLFLILLVLLVIPAQNQASDEMFSDLKDQSGVTTMSFSKNVIDMLELLLDKTDSEHQQQVTGSLKEIRLTICNKENEKAVNQLMNALSKSPFQQVEMAEENDLMVFVHRRRKNINECHVLFDGDTRKILISFLGEFRVEDMAAIKKSARQLADN